MGLARLNQHVASESEYIAHNHPVMQARNLVFGSETELLQGQGPISGGPDGVADVRGEDANCTAKPSYQVRTVGTPCPHERPVCINGASTSAWNGDAATIRYT